MKVSEKAMKIAIEYEKKRTGKEPKDVSKDKKEVGYDLLSEDRKIEVKGIGGRNGFFGLNNYNLEAFRKQPNFFLYIVFDVNTNPKLIIWDRIKSAERIQKAKVYFNFEIALRKEDWEEGEEV